MKNINYIFLGVMMIVVLGAMYIWSAPMAEAPMLDAIVNDSEVSPTQLVAMAADITVNTPTINMLISSPLTLSGEAKGTWYFEASAPVELLDWAGVVIATGFVTATGDWMTVDFVPFTGTLVFTSPYTPGDPVAWKQGSLVFKKDNPSGEPQNDDQIIIPIQFAS
ncbi:MAG: hypothetical protein ACI9SY_000556 [Candidatus Paceibacteria bacterium]|jgi:hypothetical protein